MPSFSSNNVVLLCTFEIQYRFQLWNKKTSEPTCNFISAGVGGKEPKEFEVNLFRIYVDGWLLEFGNKICKCKCYELCEAYIYSLASAYMRNSLLIIFVYFNHFWTPQGIILVFEASIIYVWFDFSYNAPYFEWLSFSEVSKLN